MSSFIHDNRQEFILAEIHNRLAELNDTLRAGLTYLGVQTDCASKRLLLELAYEKGLEIFNTQEDKQ